LDDVPFGQRHRLPRFDLSKRICLPRPGVTSIARDLLEEAVTPDLGASSETSQIADPKGSEFCEKSLILVSYWLTMTHLPVFVNSPDSS
jgi:hypothetical protein